MGPVEDVEPTEVRGKGTSMGRRLLSRMKTALRRSDALRVPQQAPIQPTASAPSGDPAAFRAAAVAINTMETPRDSLILPEPRIALPEVNENALADGVEQIPRLQVWNDRYQEIYRKAGLEVDPTPFHQMEGHVLRVQKPINMRIHRLCHQCGSELGGTGVCKKCNHAYCRQCTRFPARRSEAEKAADKERIDQMQKERTTNPVIRPDPDFDPDAPIVITRPAKREQQLVFKKVRQRVRRTCCQCKANGSEAVFSGGARECGKCAHLRCTDCPRDPPKRDKYPYGYPGDAFGQNSIPHYSCHMCCNKFPPGVANGTACAQCSHGKCDHCARLKPQKVQPEPDPEVVRSVQNRMTAMSS